MFSLLKRLFFPQSSAFPRDRFAAIHWEGELARAVRRPIAADGSYNEVGPAVELELSVGARNLLLYFSSAAEEARCREILTQLNGLDNQVQAALERSARGAIPQVHRAQGWTRARWRRARQFHLWLIDCQEEPPLLHYVAEWVNNEFVVYLAQEDGLWRPYWDRERRRPL